MRKALWTADLIGVEYETGAGDCRIATPKAPEYLALNPQRARAGRSSTTGSACWESNAIMRYLADTRRSGLWPTAPRERALVDQWLTWQVAELNASWGYAGLCAAAQEPGL